MASSFYLPPFLCDVVGFEMYNERQYMINWNEIYTSYLQGAKPIELAEKYNVDAKKINAKIRSEKWAQKRKKIKDNITDNFEKNLEQLAQKAFLQLENILNDDMASATSKIQAAKTIIDLTGMKKDKKELQKDKKEQEKTTKYEIYINREAVKCR